MCVCLVFMYLVLMCVCSDVVCVKHYVLLSLQIICPIAIDGNTVQLDIVSSVTLGRCMCVIRDCQAHRFPAIGHCI